VAGARIIILIWIEERANEVEEWSMPKRDFVAEELSLPHWGNHYANINFLQETGILTRPLEILEIGCGKGAMLRHLSQLGHHVAGIDLDPVVVAECKKESGDLPVSVAPGDVLPYPDSSFDLVLSFDVFEHIPDSDRHLREVTRVLKPGGHYLFQTPNKWTNVPFEIIRHWRKFGRPLNAYNSLMQDHCSLHNYWQIKRRFNKHGLEVRFFDIPVVDDWFRAKVERYLGRVGLLALKVVNPDKLPLSLRTNFYVQATIPKPAA
jgi:SAM-dependent methyltransferase